MTAAVLLATYCGEKHLSEQIESILHQTHTDFTLFVRDDASTDATPSLLLDWQRQFPDKIRLELGRERLGVKGNFSFLLERTEAPYVFLADQDDVWKPDKMERTLAKMEQLEREWGEETPLLVHTDLEVVDAHLKPIALSFWRHMGLKPSDGQSLKSLLRQDVATGCTLLANLALVKRALPIPQEALLHDCWLALAAAATGTIGIVPEATVLYRQHGRNVIGAHPSSLLSRWRERLFPSKRRIAQNQALQERYR